LSYRRSKAVKDYLVAKGNSPENIITVKYGEDKPIAANQTPDGRDNPTGRKFNRRAEFKVITQGSVNLLAVNSLNIDGSNLNNDNNNTNPIDINNTTDVSNLPLSKRYTIQIFALKNQKPVDFFSDLVGVKMHVSDDGWYRYYVGDFNSYDEAKIAVDNLKELGYKPFIRKLSFFQK
jgi:hypothetical protein